jgi:Flp pilus assembly protein TadD
MKRWTTTFAVVLFLGNFFVHAQTKTPAEAIALEQQGRLPEAAQVWRAVIERNPNDAAALASLGVVLS